MVTVTKDGLSVQHYFGIWGFQETWLWHIFITSLVNNASMNMKDSLWSVCHSSVAARCKYMMRNQDSVIAKFPDSKCEGVIGGSCELRAFRDEGMTLGIIVTCVLLL